MKRSTPGGVWGEYLRAERERAKARALARGWARADEQIRAMLNELAATPDVVKPARPGASEPP